MASPLTDEEIHVNLLEVLRQLHGSTEKNTTLMQELLQAPLLERDYFSNSPQVRADKVQIITLYTPATGGPFRLTPHGYLRAFLLVPANAKVDVKISGMGVVQLNTSTGVRWVDMRFPEMTEVFLDSTNALPAQNMELLFTDDANPPAGL